MHQEACAGCIKNRVSEHEIHEPSIHDQDLSVPAEEVGNVCKYSQLHTNASPHDFDNEWKQLEGDDQ